MLDKTEDKTENKAVVDFEEELVLLKNSFIKNAQESDVDYDIKILLDALSLATDSHQNQFRKSGAPYIIHPISVSKILVSLNMDTETVAAGLLHDVVEDCDVSVKEIKDQFGAKVAFLVDAVTKIGVIQSKSRHERQAGTYRKMMISVAKDFRVIMIKFADRLHNMQTLDFLSEKKRKIISKETLNFYAPLANRFGLYQIRRELEDLSFKNLYYDEYQKISNQFQISEGERQQYITDTIQKIQDVFKDRDFVVNIVGRTKHLYGIYSKMKLQGCDFKNLYDVFAVRVITKEEQDCYQALGLIHKLFVPLMTRFKDYISLPKANMYQSLHTVIVGLKGLPVEIQIRTEKMDTIAEKGIASHWFYKEKQFKKDKVQESKIDDNTVEAKWLEDFLQWQENLSDSAEFVDFLKLDVKREQEIFVFTPKGDLFRLYNGSTVLDFAFAVHTEIGKNCVGAKIDGEMVAFSTVLKTGNTIEILTSKRQKPLYSWLKLVSTTKAKISIKKYLKDFEAKKYIRIGKKLLDKEFSLYQLDKENIWSFFEEQFQISNWNELYYKVAQGKIPFKEVVQFMRWIDKNKSANKSKNSFVYWFKRWFKSNRNFAIRISGQEDDWFKAAPCCTPVYGDKIIGYTINNDEGEIHRANCKQKSHLKLKSNVRKVQVRWEKSNRNKNFVVSVEILATDRQGLLEDVTAIFSRYQINIDRATIVTNRDQIRDRFCVTVSSLNDLEESLTKIREMEGVKSVKRLNGEKVV